MGNVWRADRPQRGRYRQFMQCDIDILGEPTNLAEIELILATTTTTWQTWISRTLTIRINEQKYLKGHGCLQRICRGRVMIPYLLFWTRWTRSVWKVSGEELAKEGFAQEAGR